MTEPTDAELEALFVEETGFAIDDFPAAITIDFARAVLAKWGTPPAPAGEPVAWLSTDCIGERYLCFTKPNDSDPARPLVFGDTTPQPTQAGAVPQGWKAVPVNPTPEMWKAAKSVPDPNPPYPPHYGLVWDAMLAASPTPPAEQAAPKAAPGELHESAYQRGYMDGMAKGRRDADAAPQLEAQEMRDFADRTHALRMEQAAPKAAPGELHDHQILAITTAYEQGVGKGRQAHESGKEIANPYDTGYRCDLAWQYGYEEGKKQAERIFDACDMATAAAQGFRSGQAAAKQEE